MGIWDLNLGVCSATSVLAYGLYMEPIIHPKPGAVTLLRVHPDKDVGMFVANTSIAEVALLEACVRRSKGLKSPLAHGLRVYRVMASKLGLKTNIALGSLILALPIATALSTKQGAPVADLVREAHSIVVSETGSEEAVEYYKLLEYFKPSHLGLYKGPIPGVGSGYPKSFVDVLRVASWDLVHRELLEGYPVTLEAYNMMLRGDGELRELFLKTLLELLATHGDTLIASKFGFSAYKKAKVEAREALSKSEELGVEEAIEWLDSLWRPRGWNPGAILDILAVALGLLHYKKIFE